MRYPGHASLMNFFFHELLMRDDRELAGKTPIDRYAEEQLRLLNDQYPQGEPRKGQLIKTVR